MPRPYHILCQSALELREKRRVTGPDLACVLPHGQAEPDLLPCASSPRDWMRKEKRRLCWGHSAMTSRKRRPRPSLCRCGMRSRANGLGRNAGWPASQWQKECGRFLPGQGLNPDRERDVAGFGGLSSTQQRQHKQSETQVGPTAVQVPRGFHIGSAYAYCSWQSQPGP